jgi:hypothetical protein
MSDVISNLMDSNLLRVFNESDPDARAAAIAETYTEDVVWSDDEGVTEGREALAAKATTLLAGLAGLEFTKDGEARQTRDFGYLAWRLGPAGGDSVATGFDAAVIRDAKIWRLYTVINPGPQ